MHGNRLCHQHTADHLGVRSFGHTLKFYGWFTQDLLLEISYLKTISYFIHHSVLEMNFETELCAGSGHPSQPMPWIREKAHSVDEKLSSFLSFFLSSFLPVFYTFLLSYFLTF